MPISKGETLLMDSMATAPVKSQPLHNFSFPFLKWGKNQMNNHRCRKLVDSARESPPLDYRPSVSEAESHSGSLCKKDSESENRKCPMGSRSAKNRSSFSSSCSSTALMKEKSQKNMLVSEADAAGVEELKGKLLIRFRTGSKEEPLSKIKSSAAAADGGEVAESAPKPWNLRPRRAVFKVPNEIGGASKNGELLEDLSLLAQSENLPKSLRLRGFVDVQNVEKKEKWKFSIPLTRREIEEDIFTMTGSKPARRPKKRPKNIQKQLDDVFPGLWLDDITPDSYRIPDAPAKR